MLAEFNEHSRESQHISCVPGLSSQVLEFGGQMWKQGQPDTASEEKRQDHEL